MRIQPENLSTSVFQKQQEQVAKGEDGKKASQKGLTEQKSIHGSQLNLMQDSVEQRREKARKEATDILLDQFQADGMTDEALGEHRQRIVEMRAEADEANEKLQDIDQQYAKLMEDYDIDPDSREQQAMEYEAAKEEFVKQKGEALKEAAESGRSIGAIKLEVLKYHGMDDATRAADALMKAASKEIAGMLIQEGVDEIQDQIDEAVEKGQEQKEEKEEQEALREENKMEQQEIQQQQSGGALKDAGQLQADVELQIQEILAKQKLLEEDLKGLAVDAVK